MDDNMSDTPLISVIVPVYGVEAYLDRCVESIVGQTYKNLQIILVDDGSPDHCPAMCDAWAEKDHRVQVMHKKNGGLSDARNAGMAIAAGTLMAFVDGDDYIRSDMYQLLYQNMLENRSDISACGVEMVWDDGTASRMLTKSGCCIMNTQEAMQAVIDESWLKQPVWYKLYKTALIRDIPFPVGKYHEDVFWTWQVIARANQVSVFDTPCYYYVQRSGSIMGENYSLKRLDALEAAEQRCRFVSDRYPDLAGLAQAQLIGSCMYHYQLILKNGVLDPDRTYRKQIHRQALYAGKRWKTDGYISRKQRMWLSVFVQYPYIICRIRNFLHIGI